VGAPFPKEAIIHNDMFPTFMQWDTVKLLFVTEGQEWNVGDPKLNLASVHRVHKRQGTH